MSTFSSSSRSGVIINHSEQAWEGPENRYDFLTGRRLGALEKTKEMGLGTSTSKKGLMGDRLVIGCGYLGRRVAALWQAQGHRVFVTTRQEQKWNDFRQLGWEPIVCDVLAPDSLHALPPAETVLYCVGFDRSVGRSMHEVYVEGLHHYVTLRPSSHRLLYVSSTGVYGQTQGEEVNETSSANPTDESGRVVREAETQLQRCHPEAIVLRFAGIYGPGRLLRLPGLSAGQPMVGDPDRWLNLIQVDDGAAAVLAAEARAARRGVQCQRRSARAAERIL